MPAKSSLWLPSPYRSTAMPVFFFVRLGFYASANRQNARTLKQICHSSPTYMLTDKASQCHRLLKKCLPLLFPFLETIVNAL
nr:MAG TPA: hypothetical protein [Bacteriophage sp.]